MEDFIDNISISNFKSIRNLNIEGLTRINLFIGKPNVGKSNILEAFGMFSLPYLELNPNKKFSSFIRIENQNEIFSDGIFENQIILKTNIGNCTITNNPDYKNPETVANKLTKEDLDDIYGYGIDLFTNYETFLK